MAEIRQGDVWLTAFQEEWERPAVVISRNELNMGRLILVAPCTSSRVDERRKLPNPVFLGKGEAGLPKESVIQCHLMQPVELQSLVRRYGSLAAPRMLELMLALAWTTALFENLSE
jgi:mRNA-degrading endonuclease toxin of MazEF toxin-antitoxin module